MSIESPRKRTPEAGLVFENPKTMHITGKELRNHHKIAAMQEGGKIVGIGIRSIIPHGTDEVLVTLTDNTYRTYATDKAEAEILDSD